MKGPFCASCQLHALAWDGPAKEYLPMKPKRSPQFPVMPIDGPTDKILHFSRQISRKKHSDWLWVVDIPRTPSPQFINSKPLDALQWIFWAYHFGPTGPCTEYKKSHPTICVVKVIPTSLKPRAVRCVISKLYPYRANSGSIVLGPHYLAHLPLNGRAR